MNYTRGVYYEEIKKPDISVSDKYKKTSKPPVETKTETVITGMNFDAFKEINIPLEIQEPAPKQQTTRRKSNNNNSVNTTGLVTSDNDNDKFSATEPFMKKYAETNNLLKGAIAQLDIGLGEMQTDMMMLRNNKTMRNKYQSMSMIQKNMGDFLGNKIQAIKELNSVISKCNDLELKRAKELKELDAQDDDKRIMDLYNSMISMPIGGQTGMGGFATPFGPNTFEMTYAGNPGSATPNVITSIDGKDQGDIGYMNYLKNKTPAQNMMSFDSNPNIQQVVVHNRSTGQSYFEIMDMSTMRPVPNTDKYDNSFMEDTHLDLINNIATNVNIGESYPIVQVGEDVILNQY